MAERRSTQNSLTVRPGGRGGKRSVKNDCAGPTSTRSSTRPGPRLPQGEAVPRRLIRGWLRPQRAGTLTRIPSHAHSLGSALPRQRPQFTSYSNDGRGLKGISGRIRPDSRRKSGRKFCTNLPQQRSRRSAKTPCQAFPATPAAGGAGRPHAHCHHDARAPCRPRLLCTVHVEEKAAGGTDTARRQATRQPPGTCPSRNACPPAREGRPISPRTRPDEARKCLRLGSKGTRKRFSVMSCKP